MKHPIPWILLICTLNLAGCKSAASLTTVKCSDLRTRLQEVLRKQIQNPEPMIRCHALETIAYSAIPADAPLVRNALDDPSPAVRFAAAVAAGDLGDSASRHRLQSMLKDSDPSVPLASAYALVKIQNTPLPASFRQALFSDNPQTASQACLLLGKLGSSQSDSRQVLWRVLTQKQQHIAVRLQAAEALARLGDKSVLKKLMVYASSGYADDRMIAISGLELLGGTDANAMLTTLLDDPQPEVQLAAIAALGSLAEPPQKEFARKHLDYTDETRHEAAAVRVQGLALLALGKAGQSEDGSALYHAMQNKNDYLCIIAAKASVDFLRIHCSSRSLAR